MYAFRGKVAEIMSKYIPLSGTQLQHYLGNVFSAKQLEKIYGRYHLSRLVRYGKSFPIEKKHHLFVYALLGFVYEFAEEKYLNRFIYRNFLSETEHLIPVKAVNNDIRSKFILLSKMYYNVFPEMTEMEDEGVFTYRIVVKGEILVEKQDTNSKRLQRKCLKIALKQLSTKLEKEWRKDPISQEIERGIRKKEAERIALEKAEKLRKYKAKQQQRSKELAERKAKRKREALERDLSRRKSKAMAKKRKEEMAEMQRKQKQAMASMSVSKRRHLQDKGLLAKGAPPKNSN